MSGVLEETRSAPKDRWIALQRGLKAARGVIGYAFLASLTIFIWILSYFFVANSRLAPGSTLSDQAALLFGASSLALFILSLVVAVLAVVGWQNLKDHIREKIEEKTSERLQALTKEVGGRIQSGIGFMIGELSSRGDALEPTDRNRLPLAVEVCRKGYLALQGFGEGPELMSLNNLVYYMAVQGEPKDASFLIEKARLLRAKGQELNVARLLLTYCRVILRYSSDPAERAQAKTIADDLSSKPLPIHEKKEAEFYSASFAEDEPLRAP